MFNLISRFFPKKNIESEPITDSAFPWPRPLFDDDAQLPEDIAKHFYTVGTCPYCGNRLEVGPRGGANVNLFCRGEHGCDSRFNVMDQGYGVTHWAYFHGSCPKE